MITLDRENMAEDVKRRLDALTEYEQQAVEAIVEAYDYSLEEALDVVEEGEYDYYPDVYTLEDLARVYVQEGAYGDPKAIGQLMDYIDYDKLGALLSYYDWRETSLGVIQIS